MHPKHRTWRIRGLPRDVDRDRLARALRHHSDLQWLGGDEVEHIDKGDNLVIIHTLAPDLRASYQVATVRFNDLPSQLQALGARDELEIKIRIDPKGSGVAERCGTASQVLIDEHFDGVTTLHAPTTDKEHQIDILAVSGLGSHPFGSFVHKKHRNMWLADNLPEDLPAARVMIFGYESGLQHSTSHVQLDDLARLLRMAIGQISPSYDRKPLLLIGHSLGGLLVKQALIQIAESGSKDGGRLDMIQGILLFGAPNDGLDIESLVPMVNDQPNRFLLESLSSKSSQVLRRQKQEFSKVLELTKIHVYCLYETELSPTAAEDPATGRWRMAGPPRLLVSHSSATSCLPDDASSDHAVPLRRNHSDLVKFASQDAEYDRVAYVLKHIQSVSFSDGIHERGFQSRQIIRESQPQNLVAGQKRKLTGETQVYDPGTGPADEALCPVVGKRARLDNHLPEHVQSQAGDDPSSRDPVLENEMKSVKEELIRQLYFSKIDERLTHLAPAQANTCRWFLTESKYQSWKDVARMSEHGGFLWVKGNPGTGKSTLMKLLFEQTKIDSQGDSSRITLSFFFLARGAVEEKTTTGLYRSLLHQLFEIAPDLKAGLEWMTLDGARTIQRSGWSEEALKQTLKHAVPKLGSRSLTIFVDALDECDANKAGDMVSFFEELCDCAEEARVQLQICFSSRYYPTVVINKGLEVCLEDEYGHTEDIRKFVKSRLRIKSKSKNTEALRTEIQEKSRGIFLWVVLVLDILNNEKSMSIHKLRDHLHGIPPGLDDLFRMILTRDGEDLDQLQLCLNWILFARSALKPQELYFAVQIGFDPECSGFWDETDFDLEDMKTYVRSCSKGLAEVTRNKASEVQFIHESVRDFLLGKYRTQWSGALENLEGHGHRLLRDCCLAQLNASIDQQLDIPNPLPTASQTERLRKTIASKIPFLKYSVDNVLHHSNLAERNGIGQGQFISDFPLKRWIYLNNILEQYEVRRFTDSVSLLYVFGEKDLGDLIRSHTRRTLCFQIEAERCGAPILAALAAHSHEAVREFLRAQAENEPPDSPLQKLCEQYEEHRNLDTTRFRRSYTLKRRTAEQVLHDLIENDEESVALAFVLSPHRHDKALNWSDAVDSKLLSLAIDRGHETIFRALFERRNYVAQKSGLLDRLLPNAIEGGHKGIVKLLLDQCAEVDLKNLSGETLLWVAIRNGHAAIVQMLLENGADINLKNLLGETPIRVAIRNGHAAIVRLLLENGATIDSRSGIYSPLLEDAILREHVAVLEQLVEKGLDVDSTSGPDGMTLLTFAAAEGKAAVVEFLVKEGRAKIDLEDHNGQTPLMLAAMWGGARSEIIELLLGAGAEIDKRDNDGRSALSWATANYEHGVRVVEILVNRNADVESRDTGGRTPLSWAAIHGTSRLAESLLEKGAYVDSKDNDGRTPLSWAAQCSWRRAEVVRMLLEKGAYVDSKDNDGRTPLSWAAENSCEGLEVMRVLLEKGANPKLKDKAGRTPLSWALTDRDTTHGARAVALLREAGGDLESEGSEEGKLQMLQPTSDIA
ncbi:hypothetical protein KVR01_008356 [Diaporthe batatas]|uniref:uncharacterized protein n=1 Tax=Diaporthe batatas TaxID=748121 RepID=UPI001D058C04|nr:uncharacterized protein KVR01_008356 [Diaporthe batatas]KAG8162591.1 hypothetical protein KVR01_008356 [Diaporthe batatas]